MSKNIPASIDQTPLLGQTERPEPSAGGAVFGSDVVADTLRELGISYLSLNPGASFRGLHDSIVNHLGNEMPKMLLCLHEGHAVGLAHGYAKVAGRAMGVALHSNVGLLQGSMGIFNAFVHRMPMIVIGATGPVDAVKRRPWIDWIHTSRDQGGLVRSFIKWDDQPASPQAAREALLRGAWLSQTAPMGPVYINLDVDLQEAPLTEPLAPVPSGRFMPPTVASVSVEQMEAAAGILSSGKRIVILAGRATRDQEAFDARVALAETLDAGVVTDLKIGASFPTDHPLHLGDERSDAARKALQLADVILSLDWVDIVGALKNSRSNDWLSAKVISVSRDFEAHTGWHMDHHALPPVDLMLPADAERFTVDFAHFLNARRSPNYAARSIAPFHPQKGEIAISRLMHALTHALDNRPATLTNVCFGWQGDNYHFRTALDYVGEMGGGGLGGSVAAAVGSALALREIESDRIAVCVIGDGDFAMGLTALWTATHYEIPCLYIIANNQSFYNDDVHQQRVAQNRSRNRSNSWIGMRIAEPDLGFVKLAEGQGATGFGPVKDEEALLSTLREAIALVEAGGVAVVDAHIAKY